jgi:hypothetical protein
MPAQLEPRREISASKDASRTPSRRLARAGLVRILALIFCVVASSVPVAVHAEDNVSLTGVSPSLATLSLNLALMSSSSLYRREHLVQLALDSRFSANLKDLAAQRDLNNGPSKSLLRKQLVWASEGPRARLRPGFGEIFHGETVEPLRCSGAGVEDSRYLYVKFSFRF